MEKAVLIADAQLVVRIGLRTLCEIKLGIREITEANSWSDILKILKTKTITHAVFDVSLMDGSTVGILPTIRKLYPNLRIMIFSNQPSHIYEKALASFGVTGILSKSSGEEETIQSLAAFFNNNVPIWRLNKIDKSSKLMDLTPRESDVLDYVLRGEFTNSIAMNLNLKHNTVSTVKHHLLKKFGVENVIQLKELFSLIGVPATKGSNSDSNLSKDV
jgi:two-component system, NarL family, invasion response regulator UvrY